MKKKKRYSSANINKKSVGKISVNDQAGYTTPKKGNMKRKPKTSLAGSPDVSKMVIEDNVDKESKNPKVEKVYVSFIRLSLQKKQNDHNTVINEMKENIEWLIINEVYKEAESYL